MTIQQKGLITLIKSAITNTALCLPSDFDIKNAFETAKKHGIQALFYYGAHNCGADMKSDFMLECFSIVGQSISRSEKQDAEIQKIFSEFDKNKIDYLPLKGVNMRKIYPKPEMRRMGDADILIKEDQYCQIKSAMENLGFIQGDVSDYDIKWDSKGLHLELHTHLLSSQNKDYFEYFEDGWKRAKIKENGSFCHCLSNEDEFVYLFVHFARHYRDAGIGIRHLVDMWIFKKHHPSLDETYMLGEMDKLGLVTFYKNIMKTAAVWFEEAQEDEMTDYITQVIFTSGEYGLKRSHILSNALKEKKTVKNLFSLKLKRIFGRIFVPYSDLYTQYQILKKFPVLLPFIWAFHLVKRLFQKDKVKNYSKNFLSFDGDDLSEYQKSLNFVGLDYNFK